MNTHKTSLSELAFLFLKLGTTAFGGPAAHIAMMEEEVVRRKKWLSHSEFLDLVGATNFIPGPNSTEMAIHIGHLRAGWRGLLVAGICFILPATFIVSGFAWAYIKYGNLPAVGGLLYGIKPVIVAVIIHALMGLGRSAIKNKILLLMCIFSSVLNILGLNEILTIFATGTISLFFLNGTELKKKNIGLKNLFFGAGSVVFAQSTLAASAGKAITVFSLPSLFYFFLKVGSVLFGSGYVLIVFLRSDLVEKFKWLSESQLLDAVAVGQFTPGPVFTTATFIGYLLSGPLGALVATIGIFLPAFFFVAVSAPFIPKMRSSKAMGLFLDGVNVASLALMAIVTWHLGRASLVDIPTVAILLSSTVLLVKYRINSTWLVLAGGVLGVMWT